MWRVLSGRGPFNLLILFQQFRQIETARSIPINSVPCYVACVQEPINKVIANYLQWFYQSCDYVSELIRVLGRNETEHFCAAANLNSPCNLSQYFRNDPKLSWSSAQDQEAQEAQQQNVSFHCKREDWGLTRSSAAEQMDVHIPSSNVGERPALCHANQVPAKWLE